MIMITIQGKEYGGEHVTAIDGRLVYDEEQQKVIDAIYSKLNNSNKNDRIKKIDNKEYVIFMNHPEKDIYGRSRKAIVVMDVNYDESIVKDTLKIMGLDYTILKKEINNYNNIKNRNKKIVGTGAVAIALGTALAGAFGFYKTLDSKKRLIVFNKSKDELFNLLSLSSYEKNDFSSKIKLLNSSDAEKYLNNIIYYVFYCSTIDELEKELKLFKQNKNIKSKLILLIDENIKKEEIEKIEKILSKYEYKIIVLNDNSKYEFFKFIKL
ncbi:hypothetical protein [Brachyspira intermedia]|uniref:hypothetical protein n=1 Tax=Brachyspira intermedia TaxID=84377 RepID=UPI003005B2DD